MKLSMAIRLFSVVSILALAFFAGPEGPSGRWVGAIRVPGTPLEIRVDWEQKEDAWTGTIDIPAQGARGLPLSMIRLEADAVEFAIPGIPGEPTFEGSLDADRLVGTFRQGGQSFPFELERIDGAAGEPGASKERPGASEPVEGSRKPPVVESSGETGATAPTVGEPVALETETGTLAGTLLLPSGAPPWPVALILAGSGPTDRDGNNPLIPGANNSLRLIAEMLRESGVASLRYDKRGVAGSAGAATAESELRFENYVDDATGWIRWLRADERFTRIAVIGHSEGSLIGMLAARVADADAFISVAGVGRPAADVILRQLASQPPEMRDEATRILTELKAGRQVADVKPELAALFRPSVQPYLISWLRYDPAQEIGRLEIPVLIVQGTTDLQVANEEAELLRSARPDATYLEVEGMNHVLKRAPEDRAANVAAYSDPDLPLVPAFEEGMRRFLEANLVAETAHERDGSSD